MKHQSFTWMGVKIGVGMTIVLLLLPLIQLMYNAASWVGGFFRAFVGLPLTEEVWRLMTYALLIGMCALVGYICDMAMKK